MVNHRYSSHRFLLDSNISIASPHSNETANGPYSLGNPTFDSNIVFAALLCVVVCALGINSIFRCYGASSDEVAVAPPSGSGGLKKEALSQIPVAVYKPGQIIPGSPCPICLGEFVEGEYVRILPVCKHGFHVACVDRWLVVHSSCPTCRQRLIQEHASVNSTVL